MNNNWQFTHKKIMFDLLKAVYSSKFGKYLGFKGGTALYFFENLPRFSVDLDFDLIENFGEIKTVGFRDELLVFLKMKFPNFKFTVSGTLKNSFRFIIKYGGAKTIKFEVNSKMYDTKYNYKKLFGLDVKVIDIEYAFSHKLMAFISRFKSKGVIANRDLFDIDFFIDKGVIPNENIIKVRTKKILGYELRTIDYFEYLKDFLENNFQTINNNILSGLGELVTEEQKVFMKNKFLNSLLGKIEFYIKEL